MQPVRQTVGWLTTLFILTGGLVIAAPKKDPQQPFPANAGKLTVMSRNLYIGANVFRLFQVPPGEIPLEVAAIFQTVLDTNFVERAQALAEEVAKTRPDLIGLQEVTLIRLQSPGDFLIGNPQPAEDVILDYLVILLDALQARGLDYLPVAMVENTDVEMPMATSGGLDDIRLTDADVILARQDVQILEDTGVNYGDSATISVGPFTIEFKRGYTSVLAQVKKRIFRFANTHLEVAGFGPLLQGAQADELIAALSQETIPVVLVGDFNATPLDAVYDKLVQAGYLDTWLLRKGPEESDLTCCHDEDLLNEDPAFEERIDYIFISDNANWTVGPIQQYRLGDEQRDRTDSGLWPSDHLGLVGWLRLHGLK